METRIPGTSSFYSHFLGETPLDTDYPFLKTPISWSAIFAGLATSLSTFICLSFLVAALGFNQADFTSSTSFSGSLFSLGIGSFIVMLLSLSLGGFVAGRFAESSGSLHGFLTWSLLTLIMSFQAVHIVSSTAEVGAKAALEKGPSIQKTTDKLKEDFSSLFSRLGLDGASFESFFRARNNDGVNFDRLRSELRSLFDNLDISSLNPDRLKQSYQAALKDTKSLIASYQDNPSHYHTTLKDLSDRLSDHINGMTSNINRDDIVNTLVQNGMSRSDAQTTVNHAVDLYHSAEEKTIQAIKALEAQAHTLSQKLDTTMKEARHTANKIGNTASYMGWFGFLGGLIGAIVSSICGYYGYKSRKNSFIF